MRFQFLNKGRALAIWASLLIASGCVQPPAVSGLQPELPRHEMLLAHHADGERTNYDIWRMCGDGTQLASLLSAPGTQFQIAISPDGEEFVYSSKADEQWELYRKRFDDGVAVNITENPANDSQPAWSPDGRYIVFSSNRDSAQLQLYLLDLETNQTLRVTNNEFYDSGATFSPDGTLIAFTRYFAADAAAYRDGTGDIFVYDRSTGIERQLTKLGGYSGGVRFAPGGDVMAFHRVADGHSEIWSMGADGSRPHPVTDTQIDEYSPEWSPDGNWLAITAGTGNDSMGTFDIWLMRPDGSHRQLLNNAPNTQAWQVWRPGAHTCR